MKRWFLVSMVVPITILACQTTSNHPADDDTVRAKIIHKEGMPDEKIVPPVFVMNDSLVKVDFTNVEKGTITSVNAVVNGQFTVCEVTVRRADSLFAELKPETEGPGFYFDHISYPEHQNQGPFGSTLRIGVYQPGTYQLFIAKKKGIEGNNGKKFKLWVCVK